MIVLENEVLKACIHPHGAELHSLYNKEHAIDYLWNGDAAYWNRRSPVLFPIVGALKNNSFLYENTAYQLPRHGFARDMIFTAAQTSSHSATFVLESSEETLKKYPFDFKLSLQYTLTDDSLSLRYEVENPLARRLYFSIGAHPAFNVPMVQNARFEDYYIEFEQEENSPRWVIDNNLLSHPEPFLTGQKRLPLSRELFAEDALVFKDLKSGYMSLKSHASPHGIRFNFREFPYMGIWSAPGAPFVCIEPWQGIADAADHNQQLENKEGIISLEGGQRWHKSWSVSCF